MGYIVLACFVCEIEWLQQDSCHVWYAHSNYLQTSRPGCEKVIFSLQDRMICMPVAAGGTRTSGGMFTTLSAARSSGDPVLKAVENDVLQD